MLNRICIIGVGLIGGSLGLALRRQGLAGEIVGVEEVAEKGHQATTRGAVDRCLPLDRALPGASLVIIATPVRATVALLRKIAGQLDPGTVVTDVGSTKEEIVQVAEGVLPAGVAFVGGHPMAGTEQCGVTGARADMFQGARYILTPTPRTDPQALAQVRKIIDAVGAQVVLMDPAGHDRAVSFISHLPHLLAVALINAVAGLPGAEQVLDLAANGFKDVTRIAGSGSTMWHDIFLVNREQVLRAVDTFRSNLDDLERAVKQRDGQAITDLLDQARAYRQAL